MASGSSSSSSSEKAKRRKEKAKASKKEKKKAKKEKKSKKDGAKEAKRAKRTEAWECDRKEAARLIQGLLQIEDCLDDLKGVFSALDAGEVVKLDGVHNKQVRKKLRHLLQALRLTTAEGSQSFKSADKHVCFAALFQQCLEEAQAPAKASAQKSTPADIVESHSDDDGDAVVLDDTPATPAEAPRQRKVGPQLPMPGVAAVGPSGLDSGSEDEADRGPKAEGSERQGVDLDSIPQARKREDWMTKPSESMAGFFGEATSSKTDRFEAKRSKEEHEAFQKMYKDRGPSLLEQQKTGAFESNREDIERARKQKLGTPSVWGMSEKEQAQEALSAKRASGTQAPAQKVPRRAFDPERDMEVRKNISADDFAKLVQNSVAGLSGRFSGGDVAKSFL